VLVPATAPQLLAGLRVGLAHSFVLLFAAELIGAKNGLGFLIQDGEDNVQFDVMFAGIVLFAVIGFASDRILMAVRRRVLRGQTMGTQEVLQ
jgi:ABC-type nitrate/sulfonate/bicarbonate transport system permease component